MNAPGKPPITPPALNQVLVALRPSPPWLSVPPTPACPPNGGYLMVWFYHASSINPKGTYQAKSFTTGGITFRVWVGPQNGTHVVSYVAETPIQTFAFDIKAFYTDAVLNDYGGFQANWYLTAVMAGWEYWSGGAGLKTTSFSVSIQ